MATITVEVPDDDADKVRQIAASLTKSRQLPLVCDERPKLTPDEAWKLWDSGLNMQQIGDLFGITRQRVQQILARHPGYQAERQPPAVDYVLKDAESGELNPKILAARHNVTVTYAARTLRDYGYEPQWPSLAKAVDGLLPADDNRHGRFAGYRAGCRCEPCRETQRRRSIEQHFSRLERGLTPGRHGTVSGYANWGCRCDRCRSAWAAHVRSQKEQGLAPDDPKHGTYNGYANWGCRCESCVAAGREYAREYAKLRRLSPPPPLGPEDPRHGTAHAYKTFRCRCDACREAVNAEQRERYHRKRSLARTALPQVVD